MFNKKTKLKLTDFECNLLGGGMNEFHNMPIRAATYCIYSPTDV